ncbi:MAG: fatty acyl-AMP ligase [Acidimicrobiia bacterium]
MADARSSSSLLPRLEAAAERARSITFVTGATDSAAYTTESVEWSRIHDDARAMAAELQARGVEPGNSVGLIGPTTRDLVTAIQATWLTGATVVMLPLPMRMGSIEEFIEQTRARMSNAECRIVVADAQLLAFLTPEPNDPPMVTLDELRAAVSRRGSEAYARPADDPDALAILQFTSGSTAAPKGVMLPHRCVTANIDAIDRALDLDYDVDRAVSWLPLYHDMGLIGMLMIPMTTATDLVLAGPQDFLAAPARWAQWISDFQCSITAGPNFSYALSARAMRRSGDLDLSRWRVALNGAEPIEPSSVEDWLAAGAPHGLRVGTAFCAYGMAESTVGITFPEPGKGMIVDSVDGRVLETDNYAAEVDPSAPGARRLPFLGKALAGLELRIVEPATGIPLRDREAGELEVRGSSVTPGYFRNARATADVFHDEWLRTGDLGYLVDGELIICGRLKDVIIVGGRNVFPEDIERAAAAVEGVRAGNVIAFGAPGRKGRESIVVVAETRADDAEPVRDAVSTRVTDAVGVSAEVVLVRPGSLPKTSSGKLQRSLCKTRYLDDILESVAL